MMFSLRQILRYGTRLTLTREFTIFRQVSLVRKEKLGINANYKRTTFIHTKTNPSEAEQNDNKEDAKKQLGKLEGKMKLMYTCKCCNTRNSKLISKIAYQKGVVIVRCDGCKNNHLIADNLGWFTERSKPVNIEKILAAKGETVRKIENYAEGYIEAVTSAELELLERNKNVKTTNTDGETETKLQYEKVGSPEKT